MRRVRAQIDPDLARRLDAVASASGLSKARIVRAAIETAPLPWGTPLPLKGPRSVSLDVRVQGSVVARLEEMAERFRTTQPNILIYCLNSYLSEGSGAKHLPASDRPAVPRSVQASIASEMREWLGASGIPFADSRSKSGGVVFQVSLCIGGTSPIQCEIGRDGVVAGDIDSLKRLRLAVVQAMSLQPLLLNATDILLGAVTEVFADGAFDIDRLPRALGFKITEPNSGRGVEARSEHGFDIVLSSLSSLSLRLSPEQASALRATLSACRGWLIGGDDDALVAWVEERWYETGGSWWWFGDTGDP